MVEYFPGTTEPIPPLLTPLEAARILRLDVVNDGDGQERRRAPGDALASLDYLVRRGVLAARRFGKSRTYSRDDVLRLIREGARASGARSETEP